MLKHFNVLEHALVVVVVDEVGPILLHESESWTEPELYAIQGAVRSRITSQMTVDFVRERLVSALGPIKGTLR